VLSLLILGNRTDVSAVHCVIAENQLHLPDETG
jgi:hypothetical protein